MIDDCMTGKVDMVITKSISRFARNTIDCLKYVRQLKEKNIAIIFEKEHIRTGGNPLFSMVCRLFSCRFIAYLSLKTAKSRLKMFKDSRTTHF